MKRVVISQSMLFPWVGLLEQIRLADVFVHYDDVAFSKGGFLNRVQIKTASGPKWMTVPVKKFKIGESIQEIETAPISTWAEKHLDFLRQSFRGAPFASDAIEMVQAVYGQAHSSIGYLARASTLALAEYFGLTANTQFDDVADLGIGGSSSQRVLDVVEHFRGNIYITGHGASRYLQHEWFEAANIDVQYMKYANQPRPQLHGTFTPFVSSLDLVANCGRDGARYICSETIGWKEFNHESTRRVSS